MIPDVLLGVESLRAVAALEAVVRHLVCLHHVTPQLCFQNILDMASIAEAVTIRTYYRAR